MDISSGGVAIDNETIKTNADGFIYAEIPEEALEHELEIIELQANSTLTPIDHDTLISDTFSDDDGYLDSVNTANTNAVFDTNKYKAGTATVKQTIGADSANAVWGSAGYLHLSSDFTASGNHEFNKVTIEIRYSGTPLTGTGVLKLYAESGTKPTGSALWTSETLDLTTVTGSMLPYEFTGSGDSSYTMTSATKYCLVFEPSSQGGDYVVTRGVGSGGTIWYWNGSAWGNNTTFQTYAIFELTTAVGIQVEIDLPAISGTVTHTQLLVNDVDRETGDDIQYELYDDTDTDTALELDTKNAIVNLTENPTVLRILLIPKTTSPTAGYPSLKTYCLKLWKA